MDLKALIESWKAEGEIAYIHGWDFLILMGGMLSKTICLGITVR